MAKLKTNELRKELELDSAVNESNSKNPFLQFQPYTRKGTAKRALSRSFGIAHESTDGLVTHHKGKWGYWLDKELGKPTTGAFPEDLEGSP